MLECLIQTLGLPYFGKSDCPKPTFFLKKSIIKMRIKIIKVLNCQFSLRIQVVKETSWSVRMQCKSKRYIKMHLFFSLAFSVFQWHGLQEDLSPSKLQVYLQALGCAFKPVHISCQFNLLIMNTSPKRSSLLQRRILTWRLQLWIAITSDTLYQDITFSLLQDDGTIWRRLKFTDWRK